MTDISLDDINDAVALTAAVPADKLEAIRVLAERQVKQEAHVAYVEQHLKLAKAALAKTKNEELPAALQSAGMLEFTLADGTCIKVTEKLSAQISEARAADAHAWLRANGYGDIIKNQVITDFKMGDDGDVVRLLETLHKEFPKIPFMRKEAVHPGTLKAFVRRRLAEAQEPVEAGDVRKEFPEDLFGVFRFKETEVTLPK